MAQVDKIPPGLLFKFLGLGIPKEDVPATIRELGVRGDSRAQHFECGYLNGILASLMCRRGHLYEAGGPEFTGEDVQRVWREVTGRAEEG